jgi:hypothetical protein
MTLLRRASRIRNTPVRAVLCALAMLWILPEMIVVYGMHGRLPNFELAFTLYMAAAAGFFQEDDNHV